MLIVAWMLYCLMFHILDENVDRLLNVDADKWVHLNCALWSNEVYETMNGALMYVEVACKRGTSSDCMHCKKPGATIGCFRPRCPNVYHIACAQQENVTFYQDKVNNITNLNVYFSWLFNCDSKASIVVLAGNLFDMSSKGAPQLTWYLCFVVIVHILWISIIFDKKIIISETWFTYVLHFGNQLVSIVLMEILYIMWLFSVCPLCCTYFKNTRPWQSATVISCCVPTSVCKPRWTHSSWKVC